MKSWLLTVLSAAKSFRGFLASSSVAHDKSFEAYCANCGGSTLCVSRDKRRVYCPQCDLAE